MICIAGKNNIAVDILETVLQLKRAEEVVVVTNKNDSGENRWQKSLKWAANQYGVKSVKLEDLYSCKDLLFISLEFDQIIKPQLFRSKQLYNIHFSLLPAYKGMNTSVIPILNDEKVTGVTLHKIDNGIDTGDIIDQVEVQIKSEYTARDLYFNLMEAGTLLVKKWLYRLIYEPTSIIAVPQSCVSNNSTYYSRYSINYRELEVDVNQTAKNILNQIRAYSFREYQLPRLNGKEIIAAQITNQRSIKKPGTVLLSTSYGIYMATIDFDMILYYDRLSELLVACKENDFDMVKEICVVKEHINAVGPNGNTPLLTAFINRNYQIAKYLIMLGANINCVDYNGISLIMHARNSQLINENEELEDFLLKMEGL